MSSRVWVLSVKCAVAIISSLPDGLKAGISIQKATDGREGNLSISSRDERECAKLRVTRESIEEALQEIDLVLESGDVYL